jgi:hypothetical protein
MKIGDKVRVLKAPPILPEGELNTREVFARCVGKIFPIVGFQNNLLELEVGEVMGEPPYMHSIWIEPEFVETIEPSF